MLEFTAECLEEEVVAGGTSTAMLTLNAPLSKTRRSNVHVLLVIDVSARMCMNVAPGSKFTRLDLAKQSIQYVIDFLEPHDILSIAIFSEQGSLVLSATRMNDLGRLQARQAIDQLRVLGTKKNIEAGLQAGFHSFPDASNFEGRGVKLALLLSGGAPDCGKQGESLVDFTRALVRRKGAKNTRLFTFGLGHGDTDEGSETSLYDLANVGNGAYVHLELEMDYPAAFSSVMATMATLAACEINVKAEPCKGVVVGLEELMALNWKEGLNMRPKRIHLCSLFCMFFVLVAIVARLAPWLVDAVGCTLGGILSIVVLWFWSSRTLLGWGFSARAKKLTFTDIAGGETKHFVVRFRVPKSAQKGSTMEIIRFSGYYKDAGGALTNFSVPVSVKICGGKYPRSVENLEGQTVSQKVEFQRNRLKCLAALKQVHALCRTSPRRALCVLDLVAHSIDDDDMRSDLRILTQQFSANLGGGRVFLLDMMSEYENERNLCPRNGTSQLFMTWIQKSLVKDAINCVLEKGGQSSNPLAHLPKLSALPHLSVT